MYNTIRLLHNKVSMTAREYKEFEHGDTLFGVDRNPEVLAKWVIDDIEDAKKELERHYCSAIKGVSIIDVEEYALEYCDTDENGEFECGSDYDLAESLYRVEYHTGVEPDDAYSLDEAKEIAEENGFGYTQAPIRIINRQTDEVEAESLWRGVKYDPEDDADLPLVDFGDFGYYEQWREY